MTFDIPRTLTKNCLVVLLLLLLLHYYISRNIFACMSFPVQFFNHRLCYCTNHHICFTYLLAYYLHSIPIPLLINSILKDSVTLTSIEQITTEVHNYSIYPIRHYDIKLSCFLLVYALQFVLISCTAQEALQTSKFF